MTETEREYFEAAATDADKWVVGCCGTEVPCYKDGRWQLYVWNPALRRHGWLDLATDVVTEDTV